MNRIDPANSETRRSLKKRIPMYLGAGQLLCAAVSLFFTVQFFCKRAASWGPYLNRPALLFTTVTIAVLTAVSILLQILVGILAVRQSVKPKHIGIRRIVCVISILVNGLCWDTLHTLESLSLCFFTGAAFSLIYLCTLFFQRKQEPESFV